MQNSEKGSRWFGLCCLFGLLGTAILFGVLAGRDSGSAVLGVFAGIFTILPAFLFMKAAFVYIGIFRNLKHEKKRVQPFLAAYLFVHALLVSVGIILIGAGLAAKNHMLLAGGFLVLLMGGFAWPLLAFLIVMVFCAWKKFLSKGGSSPSI